MGKPIRISVLGDVRDFVGRSMPAVEKAAGDAAQAAAKAGEKMDRSFTGAAEGADTVASKGAQAAGALAGLGDLVGGKFGGAMVVGGTAMQAAADAGDLLNVAIEGGAKLAGKAVGAVQSLGKMETYAAGAKKVSAVAQRALNAALRANPIGLIITALFLLGAGLVLAYKKSQTFRNIVNGAFAAVRSAAAAVGNAFHTVYDNVTKWLGKAWTFISGLPGKIKSAFSGIWGGLAGGLKSAINAVLHLPLTIPRINTHVPGVGTVGGQTLIPALAKGGIVNSATLALIGEAGPEAVIPLDKLGMGGNVYRINVTVAPTADPASVGREITRAIDAFERAGGRRRAS